MNRVTILDVANLAGVSVLCVAQVANFEPDVHVDTRRKVHAALKKLNYIAEHTARQDAERSACISG